MGRLLLLLPLSALRQTGMELGTECCSGVTSSLLALLAHTKNRDAIRVGYYTIHSFILG